MQNFVYLVGRPRGGRVRRGRPGVGDRHHRPDGRGRRAPDHGRARHPHAPGSRGREPGRLGDAGADPRGRGAARPGPGQGLRPPGRARVPPRASAPTWSRWRARWTSRSGGSRSRSSTRPGHTPGSQCFLVDGRLVSGDTLFIQACGRTDLPGGDPTEMHRSLTQRLGRLPDDTILLPGHNYGGSAVDPRRREAREPVPPDGPRRLPPRHGRRPDRPALALHARARRPTRGAPRRRRCPVCAMPDATDMRFSEAVWIPR